MWKSRLPKCLKRGVAGKIAAQAQDDGTLDRPITVKWLWKEKYGKDRMRKLSKREVQRQLRVLERIGFLVVVDPKAIVSRSRPRVYRVNVDALANVDATPPFASRRPSKKKNTTKSPAKGDIFSAEEIEAKP